MARRTPVPLRRGRHGRTLGRLHPTTRRRKGERMAIHDLPRLTHDPATRSARTAVRNVHVVLPAFNEEASLPSLLARLEQFRSEYCPQYHHLLKVWVVDDGSTDATADCAASRHGELAVNLISHPVNLGLGQAVRSGLAVATDTAHPDDVIVVMDADDTHDVNLILQLVQ